MATSSVPSVEAAPQRLEAGEIETFFWESEDSVKARAKAALGTFRSPPDNTSAALNPPIIVLEICDGLISSYKQRPPFTKIDFNNRKRKQAKFSMVGTEKGLKSEK